MNGGGHGVIESLKNVRGKSVLLRSELDALPLKEDTGLPYASDERLLDADCHMKWVMHACGHDMHMASLLGAACFLQKSEDAGSGTLICVFQPNEERLLGAQSMIDNGLFGKIQPPDSVYGQHAVHTRAGTIGTRSGRVLGFLDSLRVRVYGKGMHSSTPELGIDPILMARNIVSRLQMFVARGTDFTQPCVVTCGMFQGGTDASIIPDHADLTVDVRSLDKEVQHMAVQAVKRIICGECRASDFPREPRVLTAARCPPIDNDPDATRATPPLRDLWRGGQ